MESLSRLSAGRADEAMLYIGCMDHECQMIGTLDAAEPFEHKLCLPQLLINEMQRANEAQVACQDKAC